MWWGSRGAGGQLRQHSVWFGVVSRGDFWGKGQWSQDLRFKSNFSVLGELEGEWSFQTKKTQIQMQSKPWLEDLEMGKGWYYVIWEWQGCVWMVSYLGDIFIEVGNKNGGTYKMEGYLSNKTPPFSRKGVTLSTGSPFVQDAFPMWGLCPVASWEFQGQHAC